MAGAGVDSLTDILQLGLVQSKSLSDLQIWFLCFIFQQILSNISFPLSQQQLGGKERILQNDPSVPGLVDPLGQISHGLGAAGAALVQAGAVAVSAVVVIVPVDFRHFPGTY